MSELLYRVALTKIPKVGAVTAKNLISHCGSAEAVFKANKKLLLSVPNVGAAVADSILTQNVLKWAEKEIQFIEKNAIKVLFHTDADYPHRLQAEHDCPVLLYYKGAANLNQARILGMVGTRKPSAYGMRMTEEITEGLMQYNALIVSGLAFGVDVTTHRKCLELSIPTVGIMGSGLQRIYPTQHHDTAKRMCEIGGLLTEYPSDEDPDREHFPMRNRIIAGMTDALIVVETEEQGGSMITVNMALAYGKDVFTVPGRVGDKMSRGCNSLIKNGKAHLIESAADFAKIMRWDELDNHKGIQSQLFLELTDNEHLIVDILKQSDGGTLIDAISFQSQLSHSMIAGLLLQLEFKGMIRSLPGKRYALNF